jgi:hypothetical protein
MLAAATLAWAAFAACTTTEDHPPQLGSCGAADASCPVVTGVGGGAPTDAAPASGSCTVSAGNSQCGLCTEAQCCSVLEACGNSPDCANLVSCENQCLGAAACASACEAQFPTGVALLNTLDACQSGKCPVCRELGAGDPCAGGASCNPGLACNGLWCTKACLHSTECTGLGAGGTNTLGRPNSCVPGTPVGEICFAGCLTDSDCTAIPGTFCFATPSAEGQTVTVCESTPDAGVRD